MWGRLKANKLIKKKKYADSRVLERCVPILIHVHSESLVLQGLEAFGLTVPKREKRSFFLK
jgi:hypothetical protein